METDVKTKYIDITQLPVAEDENTPLTYEHFKRLRKELEKPNRRYEFEGDWTSLVGINIEVENSILSAFGVPREYIGMDKAGDNLDVIRYALGGYVRPGWEFIGDTSCSPSRNSMITFSFDGGL